MFDFYSRSTEHARLVVWLHAKTLPTWPGPAEQARSSDSDVQVCETPSETPVVFVRYLFLSACPVLRSMRPRRPSKNAAATSNLPVRENSADQG